MRLFVTLIVPTLALGVLAMPVLGQDSGKPAGSEKPGAHPARGEGAPPGGPEGAGGPGGPQRNPPMTAEKAKIAWEWEAKGVSKTLGLSDDLTGKTVAAYVEARESTRSTVEKLTKDARDKGRDATGGAEGRRAAATELRKKEIELRKAETEKLKTKLATILSADQVTKAMAPLGAFDPNWDRMVHMLVEFKLDETKMNASLSATETYVTSLAKFRESEDREGIRKATSDARAALMESMKKILSEQQMEQFQRAGGMPRGRGPGAPGGEGRGNGQGQGGGEKPGDGDGDDH